MYKITLIFCYLRERFHFLEISQNNLRWQRVVFSYLRTVAAAVFPVLNLSAIFMHPNVGLDLEISQNLNSQFRDKVFCASLPANSYYDIKFSNVYIHIYVRSHVRFYEVRKSWNRIFALTKITKTCQPINSLNYCPKNVEEKIALIIEK